MKALKQAGREVDRDNNLNREMRRFVAESRDLVKKMEDTLLRIENGGCGEEDVNAIFRAANTIKDSAWLFSFTHAGEDLLEKIR